MTFIKNYFLLVFSHKKKLFITIFVFWITFLMLLFIILLYKYETYNYDELDELLTSGMKQTYLMHIDFATGEEISYESEWLDDFERKAYEMNSIGALGDMMTHEAYNLDQISELQGDHKLSKESQNAEITACNRYLLNAFNIEIVEGTPFDDLDYSNKNISYLYLGEKLRSIPIGTVYDSYYEYLGEKEFITRYIVKGYLAEEQKLIYPELNGGFSDYPQLNDNTYDCSYSALCIHSDNEWMTSGFFLSINKGFDDKTVLRELSSLANENGLTVSFESFHDNFVKKTKRNNDFLLNGLIRVVWIVIIASVVILVTIQLLIFEDRRSEYGIFISQGFSHQYIIRIAMTQNIIVILISFTLSIISLCLISNLVLGSNLYDSTIFTAIFWRCLIPFGFVFEVAIIALMYVIINIKMKMSIYMLIGGKYD